MAGVKRVFGFNGFVEMVKSLSQTRAAWSCHVDSDQRRLGSTGTFAVGEPAGLASSAWFARRFTCLLRVVVTQGIVAGADLMVGAFPSCARHAYEQAGHS